MKNKLFIVMSIVIVAFIAACSSDSSSNASDSSNNANGGSGTVSGSILIDSRDGQTYNTVKIGNQTWMAQNLNYDIPTVLSFCYDNVPENCTKFGRLYSPTSAQVACPTGWHLPSMDEWKILELFVIMDQKTKLIDVDEEDIKAGDYLMLREGKNARYIDGNNDYGFSVFPAGEFEGEFYGFESWIYFWTQVNELGKYGSIVFEEGDEIHYYSEELESIADAKRYVRCVKD